MIENALKAIPAIMHWRLSLHDNVPVLLVYISDSDVKELSYGNQIHGGLQIPKFPEFILVLQTDNMREFNDKSNLGLDN